MTVEATTERVLRLLTLLQSRASWTAAELRVTGRSVRRDVQRLRALGYPVHATAGVGGGYRLGAGTRLPPLLLRDEEAIATAVSLRLASGSTVAGAARGGTAGAREARPGDATALRAEVRAVYGATETLVGPGVEIDPELLVTLARACRDAVRVRFEYAGRDGEERERTVEPVRMVATSRRGISSPAPASRPGSGPAPTSQSAVREATATCPARAGTAATTVTQREGARVLMGLAGTVRADTSR